VLRTFAFFSQRTKFNCFDSGFGRNERATENGVGQAGSRRHYGSHSSVASSIGDQAISDACFVHILLQQYPHPAVN